MACTILYIEDDANNVQLMHRIVARRTHVDLVVATTGHEGLRLASDTRPDLILLDRRLPDIFGDDVLTTLKATPASAGIPVVVLSGDYGSKLETQLIGLGAAELVPKPFDVHAILAIIDRFCDPAG